MAKRLPKASPETVVLEETQAVSSSGPAGASVAAESRFQSLVETIADWVWETNAAGIYTYSSPRVKDLLGYEPEEVLGKTPFDFMPPEEARRVAVEYDRILRDAQPFTGLINVNLHKNGRTVVLETNGTPILDHDGNWVGYRGIDRDITARQRLEDERNRLFSMSMDLICTASFDGYLLQVNPAWTSTLGWSEEELRSRPYLDFVHLEDIDETMKAAEQLLAGRPVRGFENRYRCKDGSYRWLSWNSYPSLEDNRILAVVRDVTSSKRSQEVLREHQETINAIVETSQDWIWAIDSRGVHTYSNPAVQNILGYRPDEIVGTQGLHLLHDDDRKLIESQLPKWIENRCGWNNLPLRWKHKDGQYRYLESNSVPIYGSDGELCGFRGVDRDITERRRTQEELEKTQAMLSAAIEQSPSGILVADAPDVKIRIANQAALGIRGENVAPLTEVEVAEHVRNWRIFYSDGVTPYLPEQLPLLRAVLHGAVSRNVELVIMDEKGQRRWVSANAGPVRDKQGQITGGIVVFHDITDIKEAEQKQRRHIEDTRRFVRLATGREQRILELKNQVNELSLRVGQAPPYDLTRGEEPTKGEDKPSFAQPAPRLSEDSLDGMTLADLMDRDQMQQLMDSFCDAVGIASAIIDLNGKVLVSARWQRLCTDFHRVHEGACARCIESDTTLSNQLLQGEQFSFYQCRNGLTDAASPIVVEGRHLANVFIGQFLLNPPELDYFRKQAAFFGFDEQEYLKALSEVPIVPRDKLPFILGFLTSCAKLVAAMGLDRLRGKLNEEALARRAAELDQAVEELTRQRAFAMSLAEDANEARTAAEKARNALRENEEKLRTILDVSPLPISWADARGRVEFWNRKALELFGYDTSEIATIEQWYQHAYPDPEYRDRIVRQWESSIEKARKDQTEIGPFEVNVTCKDGTVRVMEIFGTLFGTRVLAIFNEITDRKRAEEERLRLTAILENTSDLVSMSFPDGRLLYMNSAGRRLLGWGETEDLAEYRIADVHPAWASERILQEGIPAAIEAGTWQGETAVLNRSGLEIPVSQSIIAHWSPDGSLRYLSTIMRDMTERKHDEEAIRRSEAEIRSLFAASPVGIGLLHNRVVIKANEAVCRMTGYAESEVIGQSTRFLYRNDSEFERVGKAIAEGLRASATVEVEATIRHRDGRPISILVNAAPLDPADPSAYTMVTLTDITERKKAEQVLRENEERLKMALEVEGAGIWEMDFRDGRVSIDHRLYAMMGFEPGQEPATLDEWRELCHPEDRSKVQAAMEAYLKGETSVFEVEQRTRHHDGTYGWSYSRARVVECDAAGNPVRMVGTTMDIDVRKRAETALIYEKQFTERLLDSLPGIFYLYDSDLKLCRWNRNHETLMGYTAEELQGKFIGEWHPSETNRQRAVEGVRAVLAGAGSASLESTLMHKDGRMVPYLLTSERLDTPDGPMMMGVGMDISQRVRMEESLRESELFLNETQRIAKLGGWKANPHTDFLQWTQEVYEIVEAPRDYKPNLAEGLTLYLPEYIPVLREKIARCLATGEPFAVECEAVTMKGRRLWAEVRGLAPIAEGERSYVIGTFQDITQRKQAEAAVRESEERYRGLFDTIQEGLSLHEIICDGQGRPIDYRYLDVNPAFEGITGIPRSQWIGRTVREVLPNVEEYWIQAFGQVALTGKPAHFENYVKELDQHYEVMAYSPKPNQFAVLALNVTDRKRVEEEREKLFQELNVKNKELEELLYAASHDLRTPLVSIQGFAHELEKACSQIVNEVGSHAGLSESLQEILRNRLPMSLRFIKASSSKMDSLISGLLRISRTGRAVLHPECLDINAMLESIAAAMAFQIEKTGASLTVAPLPRCLADAELVNQVFTNLIDNALKYRDPQRPLQIRITGEVRDNHAVYCVEDTGIGVSPEHQKKIWELFHRLDPKGLIAGEGLGLTLVRQIVERHGGTSWIESQPGEGSRFFIALPAAP